MFFRNYSKPGKGVNKRNPDQTRGQIFVEILPRNIWKLTKLNLLYLMALIPFLAITMILSGLISSQIVSAMATHFETGMTNDVIVKYDLLIRLGLSFLFTVFLGQGPVTAGMTFIAREYGNENNCWLISDFFDKVKANFKQGIVLWIVDLLVLFGGVVAITFYVTANLSFLAVVVIALLNIYILAHIYIYQMMITYDLKLRYLLSNSVLIALGELPRSLLIYVSMIVVYIALPTLVLFFGKGLIFLVVLIAEIILFPTLTAFSVNFYIKPLLEKYVSIKSIM